VLSVLKGWKERRKHNNDNKGVDPQRQPTGGRGKIVGKKKQKRKRTKSGVVIKGEDVVSAN
jgi:hypothetical protein